MAEQSPFFGAPPAGGEEKKHTGFFGGKHEEALGTNFADLSLQINNVSRRLRILEERYTSLRKKTQETDQNALNLSKGMNRELKVSQSELVDFRREFYDLRDKVKLIVKELKDCAKTDEVKVLENYINLWEPINFVTKNEVERIVEEKIEERLGQVSMIRNER